MTTVMRHAPLQGTRQMPSLRVESEAVIASDDHANQLREQLRSAFALELDELFASTKAQALAQARSEMAAQLEAERGKLEREHQDLVKQHEKTLAAKLQQCALMLGQLQDIRQQLARDVEAGAVEVAYAGLVKVISQRLAAASHELMRDIVTQSLQELTDEVPVRIRLHPRDAEQLSTHAEMMSWHSAIQADEAMSPGDCLIETVRHGVNAGLQYQMRVLQEALANAYASAS